MKKEIFTHTNNLINESSPYLLQHAHNPVNWYAWNDESFKKAESENKLIFLSIGYSTCHWCHVMAHESFEDEEVAELMNRGFISIKVDREERPDLDAVFMETAMMLNRQGGWPLNLILTPDRRPFYAATYIPKKGNSYTAGITDLLPQIEKMWKENPAKLADAAANVVQALKDNNLEAGAVPGFKKSAEKFQIIRKAAVSDLENRYDSQFGGFGQQPKFPQPQNILLLLRQYNNTGADKYLEMAENSLRHMRSGGIFDQTGFGFHRYSTDRKWILPHFEKMLYDQAMLILACTEVYQITRKFEFRRTAEEIIEYVLRELRDSKGGFYSAEDADSEGQEGLFYTWTYEEFTSLLDNNGFNGEKYAVFFNLTKEGNFADEAAKQKDGKNILFLTPGSRSAEDTELNNVRKLLFSEREKRPRPYKDDKILTDWNGLMIFALAKASWSFGNKTYLEAAKTAADFILAKLSNTDGSLVHSCRHNKTGATGMIDDYAFLIRGILELYRATFDPEYIKEAVRLTAYADKHFKDPIDGGYFQSGVMQTDLLIRKKALMDNAIPSGNSVMYENLMQLFKLTGDTTYRESADGILLTADNKLGKYPSAFAMLISSFDYSTPSGREIVISGNIVLTDRFISEINKWFMPGCVLLVKTPDTEKMLCELAPYTKDYPLSEDGKPAAYVCTGFTCSKPVYSVKEIANQIKPQEEH